MKIVKQSIQDNNNNNNEKFEILDVFTFENVHTIVAENEQLRQRLGTFEVLL